MGSEGEVSLRKRGLGLGIVVWAQKSRFRLRNYGVGSGNEVLGSGIMAWVQKTRFRLRNCGLGSENEVWAQKARFRLGKRGLGLGVVLGSENEV